MVQPYGAATHNDDGYEGSDVREGESSALLGGNRDSTVKRVEKPDGHASVVSSISNLANTIIGSGMLTFPLAMASAGIIPGIITCVFSGSVAAFGLHLLSVCATKTAHRRSSFFAVAQLTFPKAAVFFDAAIATKCFGVSISYLIIIKGLMPNVVASLYHDLTPSGTEPPEWALSGRIWISLFMVVLLPLAFLRRLDSLRHTSYIALFSVAYLVIIVVRCYFWPLKNMPERGEVYWVNFTPKFISTFPVQVFAFTCAQNLFPIFNEVKGNTQKRLNMVIGTSIGSAVVTYEIIAVLGYLTFGSKVGANIIAMYPSTSVFVAVGQLAIVILVLFSYPLQVHPCRNCLDKVFHAGEVAPPPEQGEDAEDLDHASHDMTPFKHTMLTLAIVGAGFAIAYFVDDLQMGNTSPPSSSSAHHHHQTSASSAPNSRVPSPPPPINSMSESQSTHAAASSSTTSLVTSPSIANSDSPPPSIMDAARSSSPTTSLNGSQSQNGELVAQANQTPDVDPQIIEALKSKDRLYVLKLGELMEGLINDRKLTPETDQVTKLIYVSLAADSKVYVVKSTLSLPPPAHYSLRPLKRIAELVPAEPTTQPAFKIMRRTQLDRNVKPRSSTSSVTGEDADLSDVEPSEAGSMGGRSSVTGGSNKKRMTIEEREAAYKEARSRIFSDYDEKGKDRDISASSSSLSVASVAASTSGGSVGDVDDCGSSLATESERSGPSFARRSNTMSTSSSSRSMRSGLTSNGSGSSRNSRAASPSFTYASLYDPSGQTGSQYDPHSQTAYPPGPYMYPYPQQPPNAPYAYQFYHYPYSHVPPPAQNTPEGSTPSEMYSPPPQMMYAPSYAWPPPNQPPMHPPPPMSHQNSNNGQMPSVPQSPPQHPQPAPPQQQQYPQYMPPPQAYYPMPGYYTPPTGQPMHPAPSPGAPQFYDDSRLMNSSVPGNGNTNPYIGPDNQSMRGGGHGNGYGGRNGGRGGHNGGKSRGGGPTRSAWSYGPGISMGGMPMGSGNSSSASSVNGEAVAPRFNSSMRRTSNTSTGSSGQYRPSSNGDEAASQTSSTSSSSRRTYTSTTSSQHPLPPRPDWAVGLKPDPTLHASSRHHESHNGSRNLSPISPPRSLNGGPSHSNSPRPRPHQDQGPHPALQPNDFPPLSVTSEKRPPAPAVGGAWTNAASRSLLMTPPTGSGNPVVHHPASAAPQAPVVGPNHQNVNPMNSMPRLDESNGFERPPPKATELYNPKAGGARRGRPNNMISGGIGRGNFHSTPDPDLALQFGSMTMGGDTGFQQNSSYPPAGLS
ncbi:hypothetical protein V5O48_004682 [Marasmius crinis-equi]|uniref:SUZ domain-containing protein n=1 Tax=Marasmius crinis-equi TaxID=585013 RepID=A0ABR3FPC9_9AGAR